MAEKKGKPKKAKVPAPVNAAPEKAKKSTATAPPHKVRKSA